MISTSSGFKYIRFYILLKISYQEIYRIVKPKNIFNKNLFNTQSKISDDDSKIAFLVFILFIVSIFILSSNKVFYDRIIQLSDLYNIDLIIKHPNYEDIDEFSKLCSTLVVFTNSEDAESNDIIYNIINSKDSHYKQVLVCSDEGVEVHENNSYG